MFTDKLTSKQRYTRLATISNGWGDSEIPNMPRFEGGFPSTISNLNFWSNDVNIRNISWLARGFPMHSRGPGNKK